jgi:DNA-binding NarL/FixJ family response regulator
MDKIRVVIVDDHAMVRAGFRLLLEQMKDVEVAGEANSGRRAIELVRTEHPDLVLMDIGMDGMNGLQATARIAQEFPDTKVLMLSMHANEEYVLQATQAGAYGYILKDGERHELEIAIRLIAQGKTYFTPAVSRRVLDRYMSRLDAEIGPLERLTPRQREILQLIAEGNSNKQIASILNISLKTVDTHRMQLMERLDIHDVAGLVRFAIRTGLILPK